MMNFVAIDFETANSSRASVCQIGLAFVQDGVIRSSVSTLIKPPSGHDKFGTYNVRVHGIEPADVADAPTWDVVQPQMLDYLRGRHVVAHNASFEKSVIAQASRALKLPTPAVQIHCSVNLSRRVNPEFTKHRLNLVMQEFGMTPENHHDAGADAVMNARIVLAMAEKAGASTFEELFEISPRDKARRIPNNW